MHAIHRARAGGLPIFVAVALLVLLGRGTVRAAMTGASGGGHVGGAHGGIGVGSMRPRAAVGTHRFAGRPFGDRRVLHRRGDRRRFFPYIAGVPYDDWYWYDQDDGYPDASDTSPRGHQHSGYCDISPRAYPQDCVWKEGP